MNAGSSGNVDSKAAIEVGTIRPYGDTDNDGKIQLSFTLPVPAGARAKEAARRLVLKMGFEDAEVAHMREMGTGFTFFVVYGRCLHSVNYDEIEAAEVKVAAMSHKEIEQFIEAKIGRPIVVVAACTGTDAHTVGIDAIINVKGYNGEKGLESYNWFKTYNLGSQVPNEDLIAKAVEVGADAILVSQVVTQKNVHITNLTRLADLLEAEGLREKIITIVGGPRVGHEFALELGFDAGFGPGTIPTHVGSYLAQELARRQASASALASAR